MTWNELLGDAGPGYDNLALGPIGCNDAAFLAAVAAYVRPAIAVEYGSLEGHSAAVLCKWSGVLFCVDIEEPRAGLRRVAADNPNVRCVRAPMQDWTPPVAPPGFGPDACVELVYFDASHNTDDSLAAYARLRPRLAPGAILLVHDTGDWAEPPPPAHAAMRGARAEHVAGERSFVAAMQRDGWNAVSLNNRRQLRHGITILQQAPEWKT